MMNIFRGLSGSFLLIVLFLALDATGAQAQFNPSAMKRSEGFKRPTVVERVRRRSIEKDLANIQSDTTSGTEATTNETYSKHLREAQQKRFAEESKIRGIDQREDRVLNRSARKTARELERQSLTPRLGGTRYQVRPIRLDVKKQAGSLPDQEEAEDAEKAEETSVNPCAGFTRQRLTRCLDDHRKDREAPTLGD